MEIKKDAFLFSGGFPRIHDKHIRPHSFFRSYVSTYIEKDVRQLKNIVALDTLSLSC